MLVAGPTEPLTVLSSGNLQLQVTRDARVRLRFVRRSDGWLMLEESVAHVFAPVNLTGQATGADHLPVTERQFLGVRRREALWARAAPTRRVHARCRQI